HEGDRRPPPQDGIEIHLLEYHPAVLDRPSRHLLQVAHHRCGVGPAVSLDDPDDYVHALLLEPLPFLEHLVGLPHPGGEPEVHLHPTPLLLADHPQELLGASSGPVSAHAPPPPRSTPAG